MFCYYEVMSLRRIYSLWAIALAISVGISILFFLLAMKKTYGNISGHEDFDGLVYAIESFLIIVFSTGLISSSLVLILNKQRSDQILAKRVAVRLFSFHSIAAIFGLLTINFAFIYLNPVGLFAFIALPDLAWKASNDKKHAKKWTIVFVCLLAVILLVGALEFLSIVLSDPYLK